MTAIEELSVGTLRLKHGYPCKSCGATDARPEKKYGICITCTNRYKYWLGEQRHTEDRFNDWLAWYLFKEIKRLENNGIAGRCEAITYKGAGQNGGYQCGAHAVTIRDGFRVCTKHLGATNPRFINEPVDMYKHFTEVLIGLCSEDRELRKVIREVYEVVS